MVEDIDTLRNVSQPAVTYGDYEWEVFLFKEGGVFIFEAANDIICANKLLPMPS